MERVEFGLDSRGAVEHGLTLGLQRLKGGLGLAQGRLSVFVQCRADRLEE